MSYTEAHLRQFFDSNRPAVTLCAAAALIGAAWFFLTGGTKESEVVARASVSPAERDLLRELTRLRASPFPRDRERILSRAPELAKRYGPPMRRLLVLGEHELLQEAAEYAGAMGVVELAGPLAALALSPDSHTPATRIHAMLSVERLQPWSAADLERMVERGTVPVRIGALRISARRPDAPWPAIVKIIRSAPLEPEPGVDLTDRAALLQAAVEAIPKDLDGELKAELWDLVAANEAGPAALALRALARTEPDPAVLGKVLGGLGQLEEDALIAATDLLTTWGRSLPDTAPVWSVVEAQHNNPELRERALYCLERTRSIDAAKLGDQLPMWPPNVRLFAARCLIHAGEESGFRTLMNLIDTAEEQRARQLLAWLTGMSAGSDPIEFEARRDEALRRAGSRLPAAVFDAPIEVVTPEPATPR